MEQMRISSVDTQPDGISLNCAFRVFRHYKPKNKNFSSQVVANYLKMYDPYSCYDEYGVVPKNTKISRKSIDRYNKPSAPLTKNADYLYSYCALSLPEEFHFLKGSTLSTYDVVLTSLNSTTSPGYPWNLCYPDKFSYWLSNDCAYFNYYWDKLGTDDPVPVMSCVSVKEEIRLQSKLDEDKARTIIAMDVNHIVAHAILYRDQSLRLVNNSLNCVSALGHSFFNGGAQKLHYHMHPWGLDMSNLLSCDGKQYDSCYFKRAFDHVENFQYDMLHSDFKNAQTKLRSMNLINQITTSVLVDLDGFCYLKPEGGSGNNSGQFLTTMHNILKGFMDALYIWSRAVPVEYKGYTNFKKYVRLVIVGDDWFMNVHDCVKQYFNSAAIHRFGLELNMTYEFEDENFSTFDKLSFCGHTFEFKYDPVNKVQMWYPNINCNKMRATIVKYNSHINSSTEMANLISMCCGLRIETFVCDKCRPWFDSLYHYLISKSSGHVDADSAAMAYLSDTQLWMLYSGISGPDVDRMPIGRGLGEITTL
jgi:hypothetical protein